MKIHKELRLLIDHYRLLAEEIGINETTERYEEAQTLYNIADELEELLNRSDIKAEEE